MLAQPYRLTAESDYEKVKSKGKKLTNRFVTLLYIKAKNDRYPRFGLIVSKKISPHASARNRVKRVLSEAVRQNIYRIDKDHNCVLIARPATLKSTTSEIMASINKLFDRSEILKK